MNNIAKNMIAAAVAGALVCALAGCGGRPEKKAERLTIVDGGKSWSFVPVNGKSHLNMALFGLAGKENADESDILSMPLFWIAEKPVSEGDFAALMGRSVREGRSAEQAVTEIEWEDALAFCERFTERYASQLPRGVLATMPTSQEWAHAVKVLDYPDWLNGEVGALLFTRNQYGGFLCAPGRIMPMKYDLATSLVNVAKRGKAYFAGLRLALVDIEGGNLVVNGKPFDNTMVSRGVILAESGILDPAKRQLKRVLAKGKLSEEQRDRATRVLPFLNQDHDTGFEDWSSLVELAAEAAERRGFSIMPFTYLWSMRGVEAEMENEEVVNAYAEKGISGEWVPIGDLPENVRKRQSLGETYSILVDNGGDIETREFEISPKHLVQVLRCDFTGDGIKDMVVESFGNVGSAGYCYDFFAGRPDGSRVHCESLQTVGLCVLPKNGGGACGFLHFSKVENPVLAAEILTFQDEKPVYERAVEKDTAMIDVFPNKIYFAAPFIGTGYGLGWMVLEGRGVWYRPLFWPWKQGTVQGL